MIWRLSALLSLVAAAMMVEALLRCRYPADADLVRAAYWAFGVFLALALGITLLVALYAALCGYHLWRWWNRRGPRIRDRVVGVVRDLGHRLTVTPEPEPDR